jgi:hypothetical protein
MLCKTVVILAGQIGFPNPNAPVNGTQQARAGPQQQRLTAAFHACQPYHLASKQFLVDIFYPQAVIFYRKASQR